MRKLRFILKHWPAHIGLNGTSFCEVGVENAIRNRNDHDEDDLNNDDEVNNEDEVNNDDEHHIGLNGVVALGLGGGDNRMG